MAKQPAAASVLVTGGASGIGAAIVRAFRSTSHHVVFCDRDGEAGAALARDTGATFVEMDATEAARIDALFATHAPFGILVNNVGVDQHAFFTDTDPDTWRALLAVNLESTFAFTLHALPAMQSANWGRIINISSEAGRLGSKGGAIYAAAKAGVIGFTRSLARENARYGITCNAVLPGPIRTPMVERGIAQVGPKLEQAMAALTLLRRLGEPEEVAAAVVFLASREAGFITGESLGVSGGMGCGVA